MGRTSLGTAVLVGMGVAAFAALTACGTSDPDAGDPTPASSPTSTAPPPSSADDRPSPEPTVDAQSLWQKALSTTASAGRSDIEVQLITNVEGFERITQGDGFIDLAGGAGDVTWTDDRATTREVISQTGHYLEIDGTWFEVPDALPTSVAFDPLAGLDAASNVAIGGSEDVLGAPAVSLTADLPADAGYSGFSEEELTVFEPTTGFASATIWVDESERVVRILREYTTLSLDGDPVEAVSLVVFGDIRPIEPISVPETADAFPAPV